MKINSSIKHILICATSVIALASCGGGNDVASGGAVTGVTSASAVSAGGPNGATANSATSNSAVSTSVTSTKAAMDRIGQNSQKSSIYFDMTAVGDMSNLPNAIGSSGMKNYNMVIFGAMSATDVNSN